MPRRFPQPDSQRANPPHVAVRHGPKRIAAGADTRAFRAIYGRLPAAVSLRRAPSFNSTVPCVRTWCQLFRSRTATDICGAGRTPCEDPMAESAKSNPAPSEIEAVTFLGGSLRLREAQHWSECLRGMAQLLESVAMRNQRQGSMWHPEK